MPGLTVVNGPVIKAGESLSEGIDCSAGMIVRITVPADYDDGEIDLMSFQVSSDGIGYNDLFDDEGNEITIKVHPDRGIVIDRAWARSIGWIKLRSGISSRPTVQKADRWLAIAIQTP